MPFHSKIIGGWTSIEKPGERTVWGFPSAISPDGRTIYLARWMKGSYPRPQHVIARDMDTGEERELSNEAGGVIALSPDGKQLALTHPDGKDMVIDVLPSAGGPKREVHRIAGFRLGPIAWTPDGRYLIFGPSDVLANARSFFRIPVEGGDVQPIGISVSQDGPVQFPRRLGLMRFHPSGRQLVYCAGGIVGGAGEDWALENFLPKATK